MTVNAADAPFWAELSENDVITINGRDRDITDHYGTVAAIPLPGSPSPGRSAATFDINVHRCDVIDEDDSTKAHPGAYRVTAGVGEAESTLNSLNALEKFARDLLTATAAVRAVLTNDSTTATSSAVADAGEPE
ncbi:MULTISPECIES: hypothetical protein [unclassified Curtobacterium]|uniref:hypothetical protein n=1 Tax=unclassified Curtobacterium TaxID=257496 RepID=UPI003A80060C